MGWLRLHVLIGCFICNFNCSPFDVRLLLQDPSHAAFKEKMKEFMANFDKNSDGRIEMTEVRKTLSPSAGFSRIRYSKLTRRLNLCLCGR